MDAQPQGNDPLIGQTIGNYRVTQKLGEGGMGSVYLAEHPHIGKKVALKVLHAEFASNQEVVARFFNEARAVNEIGHPNIVDIVDYGVLQGGPTGDRMVYFIMEYLGGKTLTHMIRNESPIPPERALTIALQVADALAASHRTGIIHRDLKPDNVMLQQRGREHDFVKLLDFGIAKLTSDQHGSRRTRTGIVMGTPAYMSPEQCEGRGMIDHRTDIYALGILLYEMLTGRVPFLGEGYGEVLVQHLTQPPAPPSTFRGLSPHVEAVVLKALEKRPDLRFPTMEEFMRALADPVGYVEAMGGIAGFTQRPLRPSNAPMPMPLSASRLTPSPLLHPTPPPGTLRSPSGIHYGGHPSGIHPKPTTLGGAAGELHGASGRRVGIILAVALLLTGGGAGVYLATRDRGATPGSDVAGGSGSGSAGVLIAGVGSGSAAIKGPGPGSGSAAIKPPGSGSAAIKDPGPGSAAIKHPGPGSGSAAINDPGPGSGAIKPPGSGSATAPEKKLVKLKITTTPAGASVYLDGKKLGTTPGTFEVRRMEQGTARLEIKLRGYESDSEKITLDQASERNIALRRRRPSGTNTNTKNIGGGGDNLIRPDDL